jgi:hypothetical protein
MNALLAKSGTLPDQIVNSALERADSVVYLSEIGVG